MDTGPVSTYNAGRVIDSMHAQSLAKIVHLMMLRIKDSQSMCITKNPYQE